jgi:hypothetical protein
VQADEAGHVRVTDEHDRPTRRQHGGQAVEQAAAQAVQPVVGGGPFPHDPESERPAAVLQAEPADGGGNPRRHR